MTFLGYDPGGLEDRARTLELAAEQLVLIAEGAQRLVGDPCRVLHRAANTCRHWRDEMLIVARCGIATRPHPLTMLEDLDTGALAELDRWAHERPDALGLDDLVAVLSHLVSIGGRWEDEARSSAILPEPAGSSDADDSRLARLPALWGVVHRLSHGAFAPLSTGERLAVLDRLDPVVAAKVLGSSGLTGTDLARGALAILDSWSRGRWWAEGRRVPRNVADQVVGALASDPAAAASVIAQRPGRLGVLLFGPNEIATVNAFVVAASNPRHHDVDTASTTTRNLLDYLILVPQAHAPDLIGPRRDLVLRPAYGVSDETRWWQLRRSAAMSLAPWQMHLATGHPAFDLGLDESLEQLRWLSEDPDSARTLGRELSASVLDRSRDLDEDPGTRADLIQRLAFAIGAVDELLHARELGSAPGADLMSGLIALGLGHATGAIAAAATGLVAAPLAGIVRTYTTGRITDALRPLPPDGSAVHLVSSQRRRIAAAALVTVVAADQYSRGWLAPDTTAPGPITTSYTGLRAADPLVTWLAGVRGDPHALDELRLVITEVVPLEERSAVDRGRGSVAR